VQGAACGEMLAGISLSRFVIDLGRSDHLFRA
jgi:hypothetical protein